MITTVLFSIHTTYTENAETRTRVRTFSDLRSVVSTKAFTMRKEVYEIVM